MKGQGSMVTAGVARHAPHGLLRRGRNRARIAEHERLQAAAKKDRATSRSRHRGPAQEALAAFVARVSVPVVPVDHHVVETCAWCLALHAGKRPTEPHP